LFCATVLVIRIRVDIEFDPAKDRANIAKHGVSLARATDLDILTIVEDTRFAYGEVRYRAFGLLDGYPHCLALTARGRVVRVLSLRRAHRKEFSRYVEID
jgi:uncharacterized DUF497 family protein